MNDLGLTSIQVREPLWLLLALQPVLLAWLMTVRNRNRHQRYADIHLQPWVLIDTAHRTGRDRWLRFALMQLSWLLIALAMAGPRYPDPQRLPEQTDTVDVMVIVDVSRSMSATDIRPDRLVRAKTELFRFLSDNNTARIGLIVFAGHAHLLSPLTRDRKALRFYTQAIKTGLLPTEGSQLDEAIRLASQQLQGSARALIMVLSDGETHQQYGLQDLKAVPPLYIAGIGSQSGATISDPASGWLMHEGTPVRTRLHADGLQALAAATGGQYLSLSDELGVLDRLWRRSDLAQAAMNAQRSLDQSWVELYAWFLLPALVILLALSVSRYRNSRHVVATPVLLLLLVVAMVNRDVVAQTLDVDAESKAHLAYLEQRYRQAMDIYAVYSGYRARMGEGASAYRLGDHARAISQFNRAFLVAGTDSQRADALYNLANSFFHTGRYEAARSTFGDVLRYEPHHDDAKANLEFVESVIASRAQDPFAERARAQRAGRGPRSLRADANTRGSGDFSLDDEAVDRLQSTARDPRSRNQVMDTLASGKAQAQVADDSVQQQIQATIAPVEVGELLQASRIVQQDLNSQDGLWKSLFEEEEGFPAPLSHPVSEPGVPAW